MTAAHIIPDARLGTRVKFTAMQSANWTRSRGTVIATGGATDKNYASANDWAVIRLDQCIGNELGWLDLRFTGPHYGGPIGGPLLIAGYAVGNDFHESIALARCKGHHFEPTGTIVHSCMVPAGMSGGPVMIVRDGELLVVGIVASSQPQEKVGRTAPLGGIIQVAEWSGSLPSRGSVRTLADASTRAAR